jgi:hypothetical protein
VPRGLLPRFSSATLPVHKENKDGIKRTRKKKNRPFFLLLQGEEPVLNLSFQLTAYQ